MKRAATTLGGHDPLVASADMSPLLVPPHDEHPDPRPRMSGANGGVDPVRSAHAAVFEAAWDDFTRACATTVAPEATYQAWLAHFVIERLDLLRVVREVDFDAGQMAPAASASRHCCDAGREA